MTPLSAATFCDLLTSVTFIFQSHLQSVHLPSTVVPQKVLEFGPVDDEEQVNSTWVLLRLFVNDQRIVCAW